MLQEDTPTGYKTNLGSLFFSKTKTSEASRIKSMPSNTIGGCYVLQYQSVDGQKITDSFSGLIGLKYCRNSILRNGCEKVFLLLQLASCNPAHLPKLLACLHMKNHFLFHVDVCFWIMIKEKLYEKVGLQWTVDATQTFESFFIFICADSECAHGSLLPMRTGCLSSDTHKNLGGFSHPAQIGQSHVLL